MKALWTDGTCHLQRHALQRRATRRACPSPFTQPHPQILIGGGGKRVLSIAAREADIVGVNRQRASSGEMGGRGRADRQGLDLPRAAAVDQGRGRRSLRRSRDAVLTFVVQVTDDGKSVIENLAPLFGFTPEEAAEVPLVLVGTVDQICDTLRQRREEYGPSYITVQESAMRDFAPVVERLAGTMSA